MELNFKSNVRIVLSFIASLILLVDADKVTALYFTKILVFKKCHAQDACAVKVITVKGSLFLSAN
jgi:hypothetical protein